jgi:SAM-dependent methyltransferase
LIEAAGHGWPLVGLDSSLAMISRAAERGLPYLVHAPAERLPFRDDSFDTVVAVNAWVFVDESAYAEVARVLRPHGQFIYQLNGRLYQYAWSAINGSRELLRGRTTLLRLWREANQPKPHYRFFLSKLAEKRRLRRAGLSLTALVSAPQSRWLRGIARDAYVKTASRLPAIATNVIVTAIQSREEA